MISDNCEAVNHWMGTLWVEDSQRQKAEQQAAGYDTHTHSSETGTCAEELQGFHQLHRRALGRKHSDRDPGRGVLGAT